MTATRMMPISAGDNERLDVARLSRLLDGADRDHATCKLVGPAGEEVVLPAAVFSLLEHVVEVLARGDSVTVVPVGKELTTQEAADLLNVSRQYLVRVLDEGRLAYTKTGKHRRLRIEDVLGFKDSRDRERQRSLRGLTALTEELGGYEREFTSKK